MIKRIKQLLCDHEYEFTHRNFYKQNGQIVMYERYICKKCGKSLIAIWRVKNEDRN